MIGMRRLERRVRGMVTTLALYRDESVEETVDYLKRELFGIDDSEPAVKYGDTSTVSDGFSVVLDDFVRADAVPDGWTLHTEAVSEASKEPLTKEAIERAYLELLNRLDDA